MRSQAGLSSRKCAMSRSRAKSHPSLSARNGHAVALCAALRAIGSLPRRPLSLTMKSTKTSLDAREGVRVWDCLESSSRRRAAVSAEGKSACSATGSLKTATCAKSAPRSSPPSSASAGARRSNRFASSSITARRTRTASRGSTRRARSVATPRCSSTRTRSASSSPPRRGGAMRTRM